MMKKLKMSYCHRFGPEMEKGLTFGEMLENSAAFFPDNIAICFGERTYTYRELKETVDRLAASLLKLGLKRGDCAGVLFPDWPEYTIALYACARIGVVVSPMNPLYREMELTTILNHLEAKAFFMPSEWREFSFTELLDRIRAELPHLKHVVVKGEEKRPWMLDFEDLIAQGPADGADTDLLSDYLKENPIEADDLLEIAYTSGTTGMPKGAVQTHNTRMLHSKGLAQRMGATSDDVWLCMTPLFHTTGNCVVQHTVLLTGGTLVIMGRYSVTVSVKEIERTRATIAIGVPTMYIDIMNHPEFEKTDVSSLRYAIFTGAPMPPEIALEIVNRFGCGILQGDGTTECGSNVLSIPESPIEVISESPGPPLDVGNEVKIADPVTGRIVPVNTLGEICHRGPTNFLGYYKNPEKTAESVDELGWFHAGDLGTMDENGNIRLKGRIKDMIVRGGENIYATDMQGIVYTYEKVKECQVVGYPDERLGEKTVACIIPKAGSEEISREEIVGFLADKTVKYLIPDMVVTMDDFPRTASGKVQKFKLKELVIEKHKNGGK
ncbi:MAG: acyl--CoA ligase [Deltaproteobacteria bacterium]|nr:acyl--CoA ligase [Deltaproteobacteria bacterium]